MGFMKSVGDQFLSDGHYIIPTGHWVGIEFFFQLLELGYEKFPHNTTVYV